MPQAPETAINTPTDRLRVGECIVDLPVREVHAPAARRVRRITPKTMGVLLVLARQPGRVVSRETLLAEVWAGTMPTDDVLTQAVTQLRKAFGQGASGPRYIETIAKGGYRLLAELEWLPDAETPAPDETGEAGEAGQPGVQQTSNGDADGRAPPAPASTPQVGVKPAQRRWPLVGAALLVALAAVGIWLGSRGAAPAPVAVVASTELPGFAPSLPYQLITSTPGFELTPTLSPDAALVAYAASLPGRRGTAILVQTTGHSRPRQLTSPGIAEADRHPAWSPDGRSIAFVRVGLGEGCRIIVMPASGGSERTVGTCSQGDSHAFSWTPDGSGLLFGSMRTPTGMAGIRVLDLDSGRWRPLDYDSDPADFDHQPRYSPDGRWIVFARDPQMGALWRVPADGGAAEQVSPGNAELRGWDWLPGGDALVFGRRIGSQTRLYRLDLQSLAVRDLGIGDAQAPSVSQRAGKLAFVHRRPQFGIYRIAPGGQSPEPEGQQVFASSGRDTLPSIAPDGRQLVFASDRSGRFSLWWAEVDDPASLRPVEGLWPSADRVAEWSWDSRRLMVIGSDATGGAEVYEVVAASGQAERLAAPVDAPVQALYLPDPARVLIGERTSSGDVVLGLFDRTTRPWTRLASLPDVSHAKVDPGRRRILFTRMSSNGLWAVDMALSPDSVARVDAEAPSRWLHRMWDVDADGRIAYLDQGPNCRTRLRWLAGSSDEPARCVGKGRLASASGFSIAAGERGLFLPMAAQDGADIGFMDVSGGAASD